MDTFHLFPLLPFELRALIWQSTVEPRTVEVRVHYRNPYYDDPHLHLVSSTPLPATLQACREARNLRLYERAFSEVGADGRYVWVNWDMDISSIGTSYFSHFHSSAPLIKRLKFERANTDESFYHWEVNDLYAFLNVKEIFVVCADGVRAWHAAIEEHYTKWQCGEENLYLIDPDDGRIMKATELDAMMDQE
ncbi:hypothetical protein N658DRAFT_491384 [Parathielavia hyrcaniae]|uniref:2EXR domain-containing protein n=1 Tax=Parathielavia hyrcaniae TaxID=113614 RepID=A0AAN6QG25_9PEZI|nr:hypothetical protein N658DRAFT_491384 [Parathielavia hyrcaniae]